MYQQDNAQSSEYEPDKSDNTDLLINVNQRSGGQGTNKRQHEFDWRRALGGKCITKRQHEIVKNLEKFDLDHDGQFSISEVVNIIEMNEDLKESSQQKTKLIGALLVSMLVLIGAMFVAVVCGTEWTKESHISSGVMTSRKTGKAVSTSTATEQRTLHDFLEMPKHQAKAALEMVYTFPMHLDKSQPFAVTWLNKVAFTSQPSADSDLLESFTLYSGLNQLAVRVDATNIFYRTDGENWEPTTGLRRRLQAAGVDDSVTVECSGDVPCNQDDNEKCSNEPLSYEFSGFAASGNGIPSVDGVYEYKQCKKSNWEPVYKRTIYVDGKKMKFILKKINELWTVYLKDQDTGVRNYLAQATDIYGNWKMCKRDSSSLACVPDEDYSGSVTVPSTMAPTQEPTTQEPTTQEPTTQEQTTREPTKRQTTMVTTTCGINSGVSPGNPSYGFVTGNRVCEDCNMKSIFDNNKCQSAANSFANIGLSNYNQYSEFQSHEDQRTATQMQAYLNGILPTGMLSSTFTILQLI